MAGLRRAEGAVGRENAGGAIEGQVAQQEGGASPSFDPVGSHYQSPRLSRPQIRGWMGFLRDTACHGRVTGPSSSSVLPMR